ncbi:Uncharacterized protein TCM_024031 [Theobroma cacao]|uniref:Uncharacterized protein n=1 Tax=Theobroma cacao TaxID=3641 RepID=A0A061EUR7_THECC|nr:Uncharacterized protein TCM_024031 [Theobroma cacao]
MLMEKYWAQLIYQAQFSKGNFGHSVFVTEKGMHGSKRASSFGVIFGKFFSQTCFGNLYITFALEIRTTWF